MNLRYGVVNVLLCFILILLIIKNGEIWTPPQMTDKKEGARKSEALAEPPFTLPVPQRDFIRESLMIIPEKNIFHPDRKEFSLPPTVAARASSRPPLQLFGVVIGNGLKIVSLTNPNKPIPKGERETKTMKIGDRVGDYQLTQILPDRIILEAPGDRYEILLYDPKSPKKRVAVKTPSKPAEVTSTLAIPTTPRPPTGGAPAPIPAPSLPRPVKSSSGSKIESTPPRAVSPAPIPDPSLLRGRRILRPGLPPGEGRN